MKSSHSAFFAACFLYALITVVFCFVTSTAAPHWRTATTLVQPDGTAIEVLMFGDEFYGWYETRDGYPIIRDSNSGWFCYAIMSDSGTIVSTGLKYKKYEGEDSGTAAETLNDLNVVKKRRPNAETIRKLRNRNKMELYFNGDREPAALHEGTQPPAAGTEYERLPEAAIRRIGEYRGITLLVDFSDDTASLTKAQIDSFLNQREGFSAFGCRVSAREYFYEVSGGKLIYTNHVSAYYRAAHPKSYYNNPEATYGVRARELITEALTYLRDIAGFDFSTLSVDEDSAIYIINCFYAGDNGGRWAEGLWPHSGLLRPVFRSHGVRSRRYQITNIGSAPNLGTFAHETGHMLLSYPDLYDFGSESFGVGRYCLMGYGCAGNDPVPPNPFLREMSGWETIIDITTLKEDRLFTHICGSHITYRYQNMTRESSAENFLIETLFPDTSGRYGALPAPGLAIWHIDSDGFNDNEQMTCEKHYKVSLEQADGNFNLERGDNAGDSADLFRSGGNNEFSDITVPPAHWWCSDTKGSFDSRLNVYDIGVADREMSFRIKGSVKDSSYDDVTTVLGFENFNLWTIVSGGGHLADQKNHHTEGKHSMQIAGNKWQLICSPPIRTADIVSRSSKIRIDIYVGKEQPNPWWVGQLQIFINCPSANIYNNYIGHADLTWLPRRTFSTVSMRLPFNVRRALSGDYKDFTISVALNTTSMSGPYFLDNLQL